MPITLKFSSCAFYTFNLLFHASDILLLFRDLDRSLRALFAEASIFKEMRSFFLQLIRYKDEVSVLLFLRFN